MTEEQKDLIGLLYARGDAAIVALDTTIDSLEQQLAKLKEARVILGEFDGMLSIPQDEHKKRLINAFRTVKPELAGKSDEEIVNMLGEGTWNPTTN